MYAIHSEKQAPISGEFEYKTPYGGTVIVTAVGDKPGLPSTIWDDKKDLGEVTEFVRMVSKPLEFGA